MKQGLQLLSSVQNPAPFRAHSKQTTSTLLHSEQFPSLWLFKKGWKISQPHLLNFLFLDVQESMNEKLPPLSPSDVSAQGWLSDSSP